MSKDRVKEINTLIFLKAQLIKSAKKEIKKLQQEKQTIEGQKRLEKKLKRGGAI